MKYCSDCGSNRLEFSIPEGDNRARHRCLNCGNIHYLNPRVVVGCLIIDKERVLLAKRNIEPRKGFWNLPAGFLENGETIERGAAREAWEETEASVRIIRPFCYYNLTKSHQLYIHFLAEMEHNHYATTPESSEVKWFAFSQIPWDEIAFTSTTFALKKYIEHGQQIPASGVHTGSWPAE